MLKLDGKLYKDRAIWSFSFESFAEFIRFWTAPGFSTAEMIFRGQRDSSWFLEPTLDRLARQYREFWKAPDAFHDQHLSAFKLAMRGRKPLGLKVDDKPALWWSLGQHFGLATPLLDWTESPFVASFFAFQSATPSSSGQRSVFGLARRAVSKKNEEITDPFPEDEADVLLVHNPLTDDNARLVNQAGLFTQTRPGRNVEDWVLTHFPKGDDAPVLLRFTFPDSERIAALRALDSMNVHHLSLFPDAYGASKHCNLRIELQDGYQKSPQASV